MQARVRVVGTRRLTRKLDRLTPRLNRKIIEEPTREGGELIKEAMQEYPPELPGQTYVRTYELHGGWKVRVKTRARRSTAFIDNTTPYSRVVQAFTDQAAIHKDRWPTDRETLKELKREILEGYRRSLQREARK